MKKIAFCSTVLLLACSQDLTKLRENGSDGSTSAAAATSSTVVLNKTSSTIAFGQTDQLIATVLPAAQEITWMSIDTNVATVTATGLVTPTGSGATQIIARIAGGGAYAVCTIVVPLGYRANPADGSTVDTLNTLVITFSTEMNSQALITTNYTLSGPGKNTLTTNPLAIVRNGNAYTLHFNGSPGNGVINLTINSTNIKTSGEVPLVTSTLTYFTYGWYAHFGGGGNERPAAAETTADGGQIVAGYSVANIPSLGGQAPLNPYAGLQDGLIIKLNANGGVTWFTFLGGAGSETISAIQQTSDGGYIAAGHSNANIPTLAGLTPINAYTGAQDIFVIKLTAAGGVSWYTFLGGAANGEQASSIRQTAEGGYIVAGFSATFINNLGGQPPLRTKSSNSDFLIVKLTASGGISWYTFVGGLGSDVPSDIIQTSDGGFVAAGYALANIPTMSGLTPLYPFTNAQAAFIVKLASDGSLSWYAFLGAQDISEIDKTSDGGIVVLTSSIADIPTLGGKTPLNLFTGGYDFCLIKLSGVGEIDWYTFQGGAATHESARTVRQTEDGGYIIGGYSNGNLPNLAGYTPLNPFSGGADFLAVKLTAAGDVSWYTFLGGPGVENLVNIRPYDNGGYVVVGYTSSSIGTLSGQAPLNNYSGGEDLVVIRLKNNGRL